MSRSEARGKTRGGRVLKAGRVDWKKWQWTLTPIGVAMAGPNEFDPYRD